MAGSNCRLPRCQRKQDTLLNFPESSHNLPYNNNLLPYSKERNLPRFPENSYIFLAILVPILSARKSLVNHAMREQWKSGRQVRFFLFFDIFVDSTRNKYIAFSQYHCDRFHQIHNMRPRLVLLYIIQKLLF